jgi:hypothetical protein
MSLVKDFLSSEAQKTKAIAIAMRTDPLSTSISISIQLLLFAAGLWMVIGSAKWAFATITSAF